MRLSTHMNPITAGSVMGTTIVRTKSKMIEENLGNQSDSLIGGEHKHHFIGSDYVSDPITKTNFASKNSKDLIDFRRSNLQCTRMKLSTAPESVKTRQKKYTAEKRIGRKSNIRVS